jgi:hypothetical protein
MTPKRKTFDCVAMKHEAQRRLWDEYLARQDEFASYGAFLRAKSEEQPWQREFWTRLKKAREDATGVLRSETLPGRLTT